MDQGEQLLQPALEVDYGRGKTPGALLAGGALYLACRLGHLPVTVATVAAAVPCDAFVLGRVFRRIVALSKVAVPQAPLQRFLERAASEIPALVHVRVGHFLIIFLHSQMKRPGFQAYVQRYRSSAEPRGCAGPRASRCAEPVRVGGGSGHARLAPGDGRCGVEAGR